MGMYCRGKLLLIVLSFYAVLVRCDVIPVEGYDDRVVSSEEFVDLCCQNRVLEQKLEEVVRNLSEVVSRLESKVSELRGVVTAAPASYSRGIPVREVDLVDERGSRDGRPGGEVGGSVAYEGKAEDGGGGLRGVSVTKFGTVWSERFRFASAMRLDDEVSCINVLPYRDSEGLSKYVAIGDKAGRFFLLSRNGDVLVGQDTSESPVTAMVSYISVFKNESIVVTGHEDGELLLHTVWEASSGEEWSTMSMKSIMKFGSGDRSENAAAINILEVHHVGRTRYILSTDSRGRVKVFREDGSLHGSFMPSSRPLAFLKQRPMFLTKTGAGSLDLRSMKLKEAECEGLNDSVLMMYVFDANDRSKAYGYTSDGDLVHVLLLGDIGNFKCRVRFKKKLDVEPPLAFQAIKGLLLIVNLEKVFVYNVSTQHYTQVGVPRQVFSANLDELRSSFLNYRPISSNLRRREVKPLVASDGERFIVLGLGYGFIGMYRSNLRIHKSEFSTMLWTSPVLFFIVFLFAAWHFFSKKKEVFTSWGSDDPFTSSSAMANPSSGGTTGDRLHIESASRNKDGMDLRSSGLRPPPRRYDSPSQYPAGTTDTFRTTGAPAQTSRPAVDQNFRTTPELKYRGAPLEPPGFPKRRTGDGNR
ncbi:hypothetical protein MLD38_022270 [Melastoma candidum]|uniref:Uncharacterized protein n=1 Tax=Melastoma candidum TaxID=119954 RepID=A0ACB9QIL5_9MYRT|nr:hypothetical protein MLD38_022270 [Melastoma candidum]